MARINRSEAVANQLMAATPRTPTRPYRQHKPRLPLSTVLRWMVGGAVVVAALSWMGVV